MLRNASTKAAPKTAQFWSRRRHNQTALPQLAAVHIRILGFGVGPNLAQVILGRSLPQSLSHFLVLKIQSDFGIRIQNHSDHLQMVQFKAGLRDQGIGQTSINKSATCWLTISSGSLYWSNGYVPMLVGLDRHVFY